MLERRRAPRFASDYNAACVIRTVSYNVEVLDISKSGAKIRIGNGLLPGLGANVDLCLMDGRVVHATIIWSEDVIFGLGFISPLADAEINVDHMGGDFFVSILRFQIER